MSTDKINCVLKLPPNSFYRITEFGLGKDGLRPDSFITINGEVPGFQPPTQFEALSSYFKWMEPLVNTSGLQGQYEYVQNGASVIISSSQVNIKLDYRRSYTPGKFIKIPPNQNLKNAFFGVYR